MTWPCFWVEETGDCELSLRIFTFGQYHGATPEDGYYDDRPTHVACPAMEKRPVKGQPHIQYQSGHDASVQIGQAPLRRRDDGVIEAIDVDLYADDPRWPTTCEHCGGLLPEAGMRQVNQEVIYAEVHLPEGATTARAWGERDLPAGAMFDARWGPWRGSDGIALSVVLPAPAGQQRHAWRVDGPSSSGGHWQRTGDPKANPPTVTVTPSILVKGSYHSYLTNGVLGDDLDGNRLT